MTDLATIFIQEGRQEGIQDKAIEIAKKLIKQGILPIEAIAEGTGLEESTIKELQEEMNS